MTNSDVARYFASLPPDTPATVGVFTVVAADSYYQVKQLEAADDGRLANVGLRDDGRIQGVSRIRGVSRAGAAAMPCVVFGPGDTQAEDVAYEAEWDRILGSADQVGM